MKKFRDHSTPSCTPAKKRRKIIDSPYKNMQSPYKDMAMCFPKGVKPGLFTEKSSVSGGLEKAASYIKNSKYITGLRLLFHSSKAAKRAFNRICCDIIRSEINQIINPKFQSVWRSRSTYHQFLDFSWGKVFQEASEKCPTLLSALVGAVTTRKGESSLTVGTKIKKSVIPYIGVIIGEIVFCRNSRTMKVLQELIGVQLWTAGCARETFSRLNHLGLCLGNKSTRRCLDSLREGFDSEVNQWKNDLLQNQTGARRQLNFDVDDNNDIEPQMDFDATIPYLEDWSDSDVDLDATLPYTELSRLSLDDVEDAEIEADVIPSYGFTLTFDNVNQKTGVRHSSRDSQNKMYNMVQSYAAKDRIPVMHLSDERPTLEDIKNIPLEVYLPNNDDTDLLRIEYETIIQRVLCQRMKMFSGLSSVVPWHLPHEYTKESNKRSEMVCLGVLNKNEAHIADMVDILEHFHEKYVPRQNDEPVCTILYGDGLSCERVNDAHNARINAADPWSRLEGVEPAVQEWHKRGILLQIR